MERTPFKVLHKYPIFLPAIHESLPESVANYVLEAAKCFSIQAFNAAATMARLTIDEIARLHESEGKDLFVRLNALKTSGVLNDEIVDLAQQVRQTGRNGAHAEWNDITFDQGNDMMFTLREIVRELYISPFEREKRRLKGLNQKKDQVGSA